MSSDIKANKVAFCYEMLHLLETVAGNSLVSVLLVNYCPTPIMHMHKITAAMRWLIVCGSITYQKSKRTWAEVSPTTAWHYTS